MARSSRQRVSTEGGQQLAQDNPFGSISSAGLPEAGISLPNQSTPPTAVASKARETLLLRRLTAGKGGKVVTEVSGFAMNTDTQALLKRLQGRLGTGGTAVEDRLELQGECRDRIKPLLEAEGFKVKGI